MRNVGAIFLITIFIVLAGLGLVAQVQAYQKCGLTNSLFYGKNLVFAAWMGWCDK